MQRSSLVTLRRIKDGGKLKRCVLKFSLGTRYSVALREKEKKREREGGSFIVGNERPEMQWFFPRTIRSLPDHARLAELPTDLRSRAGAQRAIIPRMLAGLLRESNEPPHCLYASNWFAARLTECMYVHTITEIHAARYVRGIPFRGVTCQKLLLST